MFPRQNSEWYYSGELNTGTDSSTDPCQLMISSVVRPIQNSNDRSDNKIWIGEVFHYALCRNLPSYRCNHDRTTRGRGQFSNGRTHRKGYGVSFFACFVFCFLFGFTILSYLLCKFVTLTNICNPDKSIRGICKSSRFKHRNLNTFCEIPYNLAIDVRSPRFMIYDARRSHPPFYPRSLSLVTRAVRKSF